ncbi:MAG TPA: tRNA (adenosine(37)-N6)-threonylcarbamoyltransferase complex dimerization subunit type 1 TsaB [Bryobacteraceae bacterium]|nr:tRNA (adenosine(37)-N6)-threonylcarbamoyltransferase complex dimerization subunit type 1 TsaB [Bryobacteraceae bacterium]
MTILAIDTASENASVAIRADGRTVSEVSLHSREGFAHLLFDAIEKCKNEAKLDLAAVDCVAAGAGPGSFTGVRVALAAVKGLAEAMRKPAMAISNLRALSSFGKKAGSLRAVLLDARRSEVYAAVYGHNLAAVVPETVGPLPKFLDRLGNLERYEFICPPNLVLPTPFIEAPIVLAGAIAFVAERDGRWEDPAALDANYVRRSDAELFWREG